MKENTFIVFIKIKSLFNLTKIKIVKLINIDESLSILNNFFYVYYTFVKTPISYKIIILSKS